jgi:hypothetical protein
MSASSPVAGTRSGLLVMALLEGVRGVLVVWK